MRVNLNRLIRRGHPLTRVALLGALAAVFVVASPVTSAATTDFRITGRGWGHGIGLSQWGARGYALQGKSYDWILRHYYQGTEVRAAPSATVKVDIDESSDPRSSWMISSGRDGDRLIVTDYSERDVKLSMPGGTPYWITVSGGNLRVQADSVDSAGRHTPGRLIKTFTGAAYASAGSYSLVRMRSASGPFNQTDINWRGTIVFSPSGSSKVYARNYVPLEGYLYGVVPRESPSSWPTEALKAQAVAARSYAYEDAHAGRVLHCTVWSQVYNGHSRGNTSYEPASTNAAINATKGQVVFHPSSSAAVKTFFSSCSGGHTANIEDVWLSSTPRPYYRGVPDADQAATYYRWGPVTFTDAQISSRIRSWDLRDGDRDYSAASGVVTSIQPERAASGYVRRVRLFWSNGSDYRMPGTSFQSALGLRSSKYYIKALERTPIRAEESDARIAWAGEWQTGVSTAFSGGYEARSEQKGALMLAAFEGSSVSWIGSLTPHHGRANIYLNGRYQKTVDLYSPVYRFGQEIWTATGLDDSTHVLKIRVLGSKSSAATGYTVGVDAIDVSGGALTQAEFPTKRFDQTDTNIAWEGEWQEGTSTVLWEGSQHYASVPGSRIWIRFRGTAISWIGSQSNKYGRARVSVDGAEPEEVDLYSADTGYRRTLWSRTGLADTEHTLMIEALGPAEGSTAPGYASVDAFDVAGAGAALLPADLPVTRFEQDDSRLRWTGPWLVGSSHVLSGGHQSYTTAGDAQMMMRFRGTGFTWIGSRSPSYGRANVYVDGRYVATLDLYAPRPLYQSILFSRRGLPQGEHSFRIRVLGSGSARGGGRTVSVDALDVCGSLLP